MDRPVSASDPSHRGSATIGNGRKRGRGTPTPARVDLSPAAGLTVTRRFTEEGVHPFDQVTWERRGAVIGNERGETVFEQQDVEIPSTWSQMATNVVVSKYFRGPLGTPRRETSVRQVISRVCDTIAGWGREGGYFATEQDAQAFQDELTHLVLHQKMSFNSPVWFNVGVAGTRPQASACFINSVEDTMESILGLAKTEGMLFKYGSGTGTNLSPLRSSNEQLGGGGTASGPVSFMKGFDAFAGVIKSGGTTRRAAKMVILNADHPDILEFVTCKVNEERKAWALIEAGYDSSFTGEAYASVFFQNSNNSVRVTDEFMRAVADDRDWHLRAVTDQNRVVKTMKARELMRLMAESAWQCGDPGIQYDTTINDWHTSANSGRINASNPCSEYMYLDDSACNLASLNLMKFLNEDGSIDVESYRHAVHVTITAQEILVGNASYPTERIGKNSEDFRPLGLGYANLGALLMARGAPYDSPNGRDIAACLTSIMTGEAYAQSARIAREIGPFNGYGLNRQPMLRVIAKHREAAYNIPGADVEGDLITAARKAWDEAHELGAKHGYRNAQTTVLAPTGCLVGDSLVLTNRGLVRMRSLGNPNGDRWQDLEVEVATHEGPQQASKFFVNGGEPVVTVETARGYRIKGTAMHRIKVVDATGEWVWRRFADVRPGDRVPLLRGGLVGEPNVVSLPPLSERYWTEDHGAHVPRIVTAELAEFVGYFMGDGSLHSKGIRLCVAEQDQDLVMRLSEMGERLFGLKANPTSKNGHIELAFHSQRLVQWWEACGFAKHHDNPDRHGKGLGAHIPDALLSSNSAEVYGAFLRGLFEADGTVTSGYVSFTTITRSFSQDVQSMLLALGFISTRKLDRAGSGWSAHDRFVLRLLNASAAQRFGVEIGFGSGRKQALCVSGVHPQAARHDQIPVDAALVQRLAPVGDPLRSTMLMSLHRTGTVSHRSASALLERTADPELQQALSFFYDSVVTAELGTEEMTFDLSVPGNVTYVANGFISHNTIGFMMDCDTTGVEPDIALVKYKKLVGGGMLKIVNQTVPLALQRLGYGDTAVADICAHIDANDTIEGAPSLRHDELAVFDCAFTPQNGTRSIAWQGHVRMMSAVQPFLSGAISKTVNMPNEATVDEIEQAYIDGWKLGLKALAIYRDGSKRSQPMATSMDRTTGRSVQIVERPLRKRLPAERQALTHRFEVGGHEGYITVGLYDDGQPGEIFLKMAKEGSTVSGLMDAFATAVSLALQYGVPLQALVDKLSHTRFDPQGFTKNPEVPIAKSLMDYIFRWMASRFMPQEDRDRLGIIRRDGDADAAAPAAAATALAVASAALGRSAAAGVSGFAAVRAMSAGAVVDNAPAAFVNQGDAPSCSECGSLMVRSGACYKCHNCGATSGCS